MSYLVTEYPELAKYRQHELLVSAHRAHARPASTATRSLRRTVGRFLIAAGQNLAGELPAPPVHQPATSASLP